MRNCQRSSFSSTVRGPAPCSQAFGFRQVLPDAVIAARMLEEDRDTAARGPMAAEVGAALARAAEAVAEEDHRCGRSLCRQVDPHRNLALARRVVDGEVLRRRWHRGGEREGIVVGRGRPTGGAEQGENEGALPMAHAEPAATRGPGFPFVGCHGTSKTSSRASLVPPSAPETPTV